MLQYLHFKVYILLMFDIVQYTYVLQHIRLYVYYKKSSICNTNEPSIKIIHSFHTSKGFGKSIHNLSIYASI